MTDSAAIRLPRALALACNAFARALAVEVAFRALPLPKVLRLFGATLDVRASNPTAAIGLEVSEQRRVVAVERVFRYWPVHGTCLRASIVLASWLRARGASVRIGVAKSEDQIHAHAWVLIDGAAIGGASESDAFVALVRAESGHR